MTQPGGDINVVQYLWADAFRGGRICARVNSGGFFFANFFHEQAHRISLQHRNPFEGRKGPREHTEKTHISFEARVPEETTSGKELLLREVALGIRLVNGYFQHWEYSVHPGEYILFPIRGGQWQSASIDLTARTWHRFKSDGNHLLGPDEPNFEIICAVVLELGSDSGPIRPGSGEGFIDIRRIQLA